MGRSAVGVLLFGLPSEMLCYYQMIDGEGYGQWTIKDFAKETLPWLFIKSGRFRRIRVLSELQGSSGFPHHAAPLNTPQDSNYMGVTQKLHFIAP